MLRNRDAFSSVVWINFATWKWQQQKGRHPYVMVDSPMFLLQSELNCSSEISLPVVPTSWVWAGIVRSLRVQELEPFQVILKQAVAFSPWGQIV